MLRWTTYLLLALVVAAALASAAFAAAEYTGRSAFCRNCHEMNPYDRSWSQSQHTGHPMRGVPYPAWDGQPDQDQGLLVPRDLGAPDRPGQGPPRGDPRDPQRELYHLSRRAPIQTAGVHHLQPRHTRPALHLLPPTTDAPFGHTP